MGERQGYPGHFGREHSGRRATNTIAAVNPTIRRL